MKGKDKERLYNDLIRISDQIGILPEETPMLYFDRNEYNAIKKDDGERNADRGLYGECSRSRRTIFVDGRKNYYQYTKYYSKRKRKRTGYICEYKTVKASYRTYLHCLVHELTHYRFKGLPHGPKFEERIKEILAGKTFEQSSIAMYEEQKGLGWRWSGVRRWAKNTSEERVKKLVRVATWLDKNFTLTNDMIEHELELKLSKYVSDQEIKSAMSLFKREEGK